MARPVLIASPSAAPAIAEAAGEVRSRAALLRARARRGAGLYALLPQCPRGCGSVHAPGRDPIGARIGSAPHPSIDSGADRATVRRPVPAPYGWQTRRSSSSADAARNNGLELRLADRWGTHAAPAVVRFCRRMVIGG